MTEKGFYLYDNKYYYCSNTNSLINADFMKIYSKYSSARKIKIQATKVDESSVMSSLSNVKQIMFELTQKCNLRCAYCVYESGEYSYNRDPDSSKSLEFITAQRALDQVWSVIKGRDKKELTIGFYGGEPFLNFATMKKIVGYTKNTYHGWELSFTITTNATLLNNHTIDYLVKNNFITFVSLDGPESNNDKKRVFSDGKGTYKIITENLEKIRILDRQYYDKKVFISIVYSKDLPLKKMFDFFNQYDLVKKVNVNLGYVTESDSTYYNNNPFDRSVFHSNIDQIIHSLKKKRIKQENLSPIEQSTFVNHDMISLTLGKTNFNSLMGTCFYDSRLYVDTDGGFHLCEKINNRFQFGNAVDGFDYTKMAEITDNYLQLLETCSECEIRFLCQRCYVSFAKNGIFKIDNDFCTRAKFATKKILEDLIQIEEGRSENEYKNNSNFINTANIDGMQQDKGTAAALKTNPI